MKTKVVAVLAPVICLALTEHSAASPSAEGRASPTMGLFVNTACKALMAPNYRSAALTAPPHMDGGSTVTSTKAGRGTDSSRNSVTITSTTANGAVTGDDGVTDTSNNTGLATVGSRWNGVTITSTTANGAVTGDDGVTDTSNNTGLATVGSRWNGVTITSTTANGAVTGDDGSMVTTTNHGCGLVGATLDGATMVGDAANGVTATGGHPVGRTTNYDGSMITASGRDIISITVNATHLAIVNAMTPKAITGGAEVVKALCVSIQQHSIARFQVGAWHRVSRGASASPHGDWYWPLASRVADSVRVASLTHI